jgi:uncharacterized membrane-anchored protein YhcB (DUF1043 family)
VIETLDQLLIWELVQGIIIAYVAYRLTLRKVDNFYKKFFANDGDSVDKVLEEE